MGQSMYVLSAFRATTSILMIGKAISSTKPPNAATTAPNLQSRISCRPSATKTKTSPSQPSTVSHFPPILSLSCTSPLTTPQLDWHERGGLVGRGILLDYKAYAASKGIKYSPFEHHKITVKDMEAIAEAQGTTIKSGDILIVRSGFTEDLGGASAEEQEKMLGTHKSVGVEGSEEVAKWVWDKGFAAVAGDAIAFEVLPPAKDGVDGAGDIAGLGEFC
jgi:hypothetical protein